MLPIHFSVSGISVTKVIGDLSVSITDDYRKLVYTAKPRADQVPISYIGFPETTTSNIKIVPLTENGPNVGIVENSYLTRYAKKTNARVFDLFSRHALITNISVLDEGGSEIPLFYKHEFPEGFTSTPRVLDQDMNPVSSLLYKIIITDSEIALFHNLTQEFSVETGKVRAYYIEYSTEQGPVFQLLQSAPAFRDVTLRDWPDIHRRLFSVRKVGSKYRFRILYQGTGPFHIKLLERSQIGVKMPIRAGSGDPWFLRISDGELMGKTVSGWERYHIPEYHFQSFVPIEPFAYSGSLECIPLTENLIASPAQNITTDGNHRVEILVTTDALEPLRGYTTLPDSPRQFWIDRLGEYRPRGSIIKQSLVNFATAGVSVEFSSGLIHLPEPIGPTDRVFIRCFHELHDYTYRGLNLNPLHSPNLIRERALIYVRPESQLDELQTAVHHIFLDTNDTITGTSDPQLLTEEGELVDAILPGDGFSGLRKFNELYPRFLKLAVVSIDRNCSINDILFVDVRERGGALQDRIERNLTSYLDDYPELLWLSEDSIEGRPIPMLASSVVRLPFNILEEGGGIFTRKDAEDAVYRHMSAGSHAIIEYYADLPEVKDVIYAEMFGGVWVTWTHVNDADGYNIYLSGSPSSGFVSVYKQGEEAPFFSDSRFAIVTIGADASNDVILTPGGKVYLYIAPVKNGYEWPASELVEVDLSSVIGSSTSLLDAIIDSTSSTTSSIDAIIGPA